MASIRDVRHALGIRTDHVLNIEQYGFDVLMPMLLPAILAQGGAALAVALRTKIRNFEH